ncbi:hypothetical protein CKAH01_12558 [Colletotrichum kahawae]|uniref:Uncharacterized protein n=1 Tax=Colletotrichum kahawae TaxID=34407 RepID=A0AAD9YSI5_COLKA|nr:hypothetical protein CKAH01_12558 [Colletotrichum kahawae]
MGQPSGLVCEADAEYVDCLLRISPVICLIDAIRIVYRLTSFLYRGGSLDAAMRDLLCWRFKGQHHAGLRVPQPTTLKTVACKILLRVIFSFGTICAFIKICGSEGLVWTKVIAVAFFFSFFVSELLVVWPVTIWPDMAIPGPERNNEQVSRYMVTYCSIALAVTFMLWFASAAAQDCFGKPHHTQPQLLAATAAALSLPLILGALWCVFSKKVVKVQNRLVSTLILAVLVLLTVASYLGCLMLPSHTSSTIAQSVSALLAATLCVILMWFAASSLQALRNEEDNANARGWVEIVTAFYFFGINFATALMYYIYSYNPAGTAKPHWDWEEWLG